MNKIFLGIFTLLSAVIYVVSVGFTSSSSNTPINVADVGKLPVEQVLIQLGEKPLNHHIETVDLAKAKIGEELFYKGKTSKSSLISPFFKCTDCHSLKKEFTSSKEGTPEERLQYAIKNNMTYLPGSTMWGIYNRTNWYNGDYIKKYGDLVKNARDTLGEAIQVCAKYCSTGRKLEQWEEDAFIHFFKQNELHISDLQLSQETLNLLGTINTLTSLQKAEALEEIKSKLTTKCGATFPGALPSDKRGLGKNGNAQLGKEIFDRSCMHCHGNARVSYLCLEADDITANMFLNHLDDYTDKSLYQILRWGTYAKIGRKQYMPLYTSEKMSDQQIEDLIAYFRTLTKKKG